MHPLHLCFSSHNHAPGTFLPRSIWHVFYQEEAGMIYQEGRMLDSHACEFVRAIIQFPQDTAPFKLLIPKEVFLN
jgi:hypothetical protein